MENLLIAIVAAPGLTFLGFALCWLLGWTPSERVVSRITSTLFGLLSAASVWLAGWMITSGTASLHVSLGEWFRAGDYRFPLMLVADRLSLPLIVLTVTLSGIISVFSVRYIHRDKGFFRFFVLLHLFAFGSLCLFAAGSIDLLIFGWELVGVTSVLLVAFFDERSEPVNNALRVFANYRLADVGLLISSFLLHHDGSTLFPMLFAGDWPEQTSALSHQTSMIAGLLLLVAACGKSAQGPFAGWLPRAMEGPTPSSSIFYGAISIHAGAYLLLRVEPILRSAPEVAFAVIVVGLLTSVVGTLAHRAATDVKSSVAYASMSQVGIIFAEIGCGFPRLALFHLMGHAAIRTLQFLRAPSMLHDHHRVHAAMGAHTSTEGSHFQAVPMPHVLRLWLYRFSLERGFYEVWLDRMMVQPAMRFSRLLCGLEKHQ